MANDALLTFVALLSLLPLGLVVWNLFLFRRFQHAGDAAPGPVSVLVPARNEELRLPALLRDLEAQRGVEFEVLVLDDDSEDRTAQIVEEFRQRDPRFRCLAGAGPPEGWNGKQAACQALAEAARYERLLFLDADLRLSADAVGRIARTAESSPAALISGFPRLVTSRLLERLLLPQIHFVLLGYLPVFAMRRSLAPSFGAGCGQCFCTDRESYRRAGGHAAIRASRHDGVQLPRAYRRAGMRTDLFDASDCSSVRMYETSAEVWLGLSKNAEEGLGGPVAIWVWSVLLLGGAWLPLLSWVVGVLPAGTALALFASAPLARVLLALRLRQDLLSAILHPLGVLGLVAVQWHARFRRAHGRHIAWKERLG